MMALDGLIVSEEELYGLYKETNKVTERGFDFLRENGLLPLRVESFGSEAGSSFLELATWVYWSGELTKRNIVPKITGLEQALIKLKEEKLKSLGLKFRILKGRGHYLKLCEHSGAVGRLVHSMGIGIPHGTDQGRETKAHHRKDLPKYFYDVVNWQPFDDAKKLVRANALDTLLRITFFDRLTLTEDRNRDLYLGSFPDKESALNYGKRMAAFINSIFQTNTRNMISRDRIDVEYSNTNKLYCCKIKLTANNLSYLAKKLISPARGPILQVAY